MPRVKIDVDPKTILYHELEDDGWEDWGDDDFEFEHDEDDEFDYEDDEVDG